MSELCVCEKELCVSKLYVRELGVSKLCVSCVCESCVCGDHLHRCKISFVWFMVVFHV